MKIEQEQQKRILISPLNWGLGHASRLIPVIRELDIRGFKIMIAADGKALKLLQNEFPAYCFFNLKEYNVRYSRYIPLSLKMFFLAPIILFGIRKEHFQLKQFINEFNIDYVISDNRFGLYSRKAHCIFITHQINIQVPDGLFFLRPFITFLNRYYIRKFNECWVPDYYDQPSLAGNLSHNKNRLKNLKYIGLLSRFTIPEIKTIDFPVYDILIILSGPEPQRSIFERILCSQFKNKNFKVLMVRGIPEDKPVTLPENVEARDHQQSRIFNNYGSDCFEKKRHTCTNPGTDRAEVSG
jgi:hypothetical protein